MTVLARSIDLKGRWTNFHWKINWKQGIGFDHSALVSSLKEKTRVRFDASDMPTVIWGSQDWDSLLGRRRKVTSNNLFSENWPSSRKIGLPIGNIYKLSYTITISNVRYTNSKKQMGNPQNPASQQVLGRHLIKQKYKDQNDRIGKVYRFKRSLDPFSLKNQLKATNMFWSLGLN